MRGKLYSYKTPAPRQPPAMNPGHMNLAAYQAFALQQRALLQHALSYENLMQNAAVAVTAPHFMARPEHLHHAVAMTKQSDITVTTSTPTTNAHLHQPRLPHHERDASFKIEQVGEPHHEKACLQGFETKYDTNQVLPAQLQNLARVLKFWM